VVAFWIDEKLEGGIEVAIGFADGADIVGGIIGRSFGEVISQHVCDSKEREVEWESGVELKDGVEATRLLFCNTVALRSGEAISKPCPRDSRNIPPSNSISGTTKPPQWLTRKVRTTSLCASYSAT